ncbi:hypothetical protein [Halorussus halophilus]|uniref:hypothetical protein n=1 Tax=Halorussus halophilus TaxID=2650975 RepID=UPI001301005F|nr:hypothetical protein [Halorussus halophilus]
MRSETVGAGHLSRRVRGVGEVVSLGATLGLVGGLASFMNAKKDLVAYGVGPEWLVALIAVMGILAHVLAADLVESIRLALVGLAVGTVVHLVVWVSPLWILPYPVGARDLLLPRMLGQAVTKGLPEFLITFFAGYCAAVVVLSYFDPK